MEFLAKKMRDMYVRDAIYPNVKIFLDPLRERQPEDTLQKLHEKQEVAACINARDEFPELDLVFPNRTPFTITKADHGLVRPFYVRHGDNEIMVTVNEIKDHFKTQKPVFIDMQRYIPGRPNLLTLPLSPVQEDKSFHYQAGCMFHYITKSI